VFPSYDADSVGVYLVGAVDDGLCWVAIPLTEFDRHPGRFTDFLCALQGVNL